MQSASGFNPAVSDRFIPQALQPRGQCNETLASFSRLWSFDIAGWKRRRYEQVAFLQKGGNILAMHNGAIQVTVKGVLPTQNGCAIFVGNDQKTFVIYVDHSVGAAITMFLRNTPKERPLTHDLIGYIFAGLGVKVERVLINDLRDSTYYARLVLRAENELGKKVLEIDARPSDCIALAVQQKSPIFVAPKVFNAVEDMTEVLRRLHEQENDEGFVPPVEEEPDEPEDE